jgi:hypothetical protein
MTLQAASVGNAASEFRGVFVLRIADRVNMSR